MTRSRFSPNTAVVWVSNNCKNSSSSIWTETVRPIVGCGFHQVVGWFACCVGIVPCVQIVPEFMSKKEATRLNVRVLVDHILNTVRELPLADSREPCTAQGACERLPREEMHQGLGVDSQLVAVFSHEVGHRRKVSPTARRIEIAKGILRLDTRIPGNTSQC